MGISTVEKKQGVTTFFSSMRIDKESNYISGRKLNILPEDDLGSAIENWWNWVCRHCFETVEAIAADEVMAYSTRLVKSDASCQNLQETEKSIGKFGGSHSNWFGSHLMPVAWTTLVGNSVRFLKQLYLKKTYSKVPLGITAQMEKHFGKFQTRSGS